MHVPPPFEQTKGAGVVTRHPSFRRFTLRSGPSTTATSALPSPAGESATLTSGAGASGVAPEEQLLALEADPLLQSHAEPAVRGARAGRSAWAGEGRLRRRSELCNHAAARRAARADDAAAMAAVVLAQIVGRRVVGPRHELLREGAAAGLRLREHEGQLAELARLRHACRGGGSTRGAERASTPRDASQQQLLGSCGARSLDVQV